MSGCTVNYGRSGDWRGLMEVQHRAAPDKVYNFAAQSWIRGCLHSVDKAGENVLNLMIDGKIYQESPRGGIARIFDEILPRMCDLSPSLNVTILTEQGRAIPPLPRHRQIVHRIFPRVENYLRPWRLWKNQLAGAQRMAKRLWAGTSKGKVWHSTYFTYVPAWHGPQVMTIYDMIYELFPNLFHTQEDEAFRRVKRECVLRADRIISISESTGKDLQRIYGIDGRRIRVIPLAANGAFQVQTDGPSVRTPVFDKPFVLYVGKRRYYKNFDTLLRAYAAWGARRDVRLVAVGGEALSEEDAHTLGKLGINESVVHLEHIGDSQLASLYSGAMALVYPSIYEGFGIPLLEAMSCGCPIVASRIPSTIEVADNCPIFFEPNDAESLRASLDTALVEGRGSERVQRGLKRARLYSWDRTARATLEVYHEAMQN